MERVIAYIDGFNLYYGLRHRNWRRYMWLDVCALARSLLLPTQELVATKYFTARVASPPDSVKRQTIFIDALHTLSDLVVIEGKYQPKTGRCDACGGTWHSHEEKQTDVNIAVEMMKDGFTDRFDMALLLSADSDLKPPVTAIENLMGGKRVVVACPPGRRSEVLTRAASANITIGRDKLAASQLPEEITTASGYVLKRPKKWT